MSDNKAVADWLIPEDQIRAYLEVCRKAVQDDNAFAAFRHSGAYCVILEHTPVGVGFALMEAAKAINEPFVVRYFETFQENDEVGGALRVEYPFGTIAPSTLWYAFILTDLLDWVGSLEGLDVVEIGGGYGGLCRMAMAICKPQSYTLFDLEAPLSLARKYLSRYGLHDVVRFRQPGDFEGVDSVDVVISAHALLELDMQAQMVYYTNLVSGSRFGYVIYNEKQAMPLEQYIESLGGFEFIFERESGLCSKAKWREQKGQALVNT